MANPAIGHFIRRHPWPGPGAILTRASGLSRITASGERTLRPLFKTWINGLRKAGLDIPDEAAATD